LEVVRRYWRERIVPLWWALATATADFFDELGFRCSLAFRVITGRVPIGIEERFWIRSVETPAMITVRDWTNNRRIFSVLVWPVLEADRELAPQENLERLQQVKQVLAKGASDMALTTSFETDYGLTWDHDRKVWIATDGFAYDGTLERDAIGGGGKA
jgi:hypothetical protein